jgi:UDP-N-acetylglucosamine acyltransferase
MIHKTVIVDKDAKIGKNVKIGAYSIVGNAKIGDNCIIEPHVVIGNNTTIGKNNHIFQFACIGGTPQDVKYNSENTQLKIGDNNIIREYSTINLGTINGNGITKIGNNNFFMISSHIAHDCVVGNNVIISNLSALAGHVTIRDNVNIGGIVGVHQFTEIGEYSFIGFSSAVNRNVPPFIKVSGNHAKACGINKVGLQRAGFSNKTIESLHRFYLKYIKSKKPQKQREIDIENLIMDCPKTNALYSFIKNSQRPVVR